MEFLLIMGGCVILLGIAYVATTIRIQQSEQGIANWPKTPGSILSSFVYRHERKTSHANTVTYTPTLSYTYTVEGEMHTAHRRDAAAYTQVSVEDEAQANETTGRYSAGGDITVRYNPNAPTQAILEPGRPIAQNMVLFYGVMNIIVGGGIIALYFALR